MQPEYNAASNGRRLKVWRQPLSGPNTSTTGALQTIRKRQRGAVRNDPWAGAAGDKLVSNMVGTGVQAKTVNGNDAQKAQIKTLWDAWCKVSDADWVLDFYGQQALAVREWAGEVGECFARLRHRRAEDGLPVPLQVQLIEAEQCPAEYWGTAKGGNQIKAGIEFDRIGRRAAYWMYRSHPGDLNPMSIDSGQLVRIPADEILHLYEPQRAGQIRGVPYAASALVRMFNLDSLDDAVLDRQKIANLFSVYFTSAGPEDPQPGVAQSLQTGIDDDGTPMAGLEPGSGYELPPGVKPEFSEPPQPGVGYAEFYRHHLLAIAARHGVPYEVLTGDLKGVSDRALRLILNEFRRMLEQRQWLYLIPQFCQRIREAWFDAAVLAGALDLPGYSTRRSEYTETLWVPQGWPYSHPVQDVDADIKAIRAGLASRTGRVLGTGEDPEQIDREQTEDNNRADAAGLSYDSDGRKPKSGTGTKAGPTDDEDADEPSGDGDKDDEDGDAGESSTAQTTPPNVTVNLAPPAVHIHQAPTTHNIAGPTVNVPAPVVNIAPPAMTVNIPPAQISDAERALMEQAAARLTES